MGKFTTRAARSLPTPLHGKVRWWVRLRFAVSGGQEEIRPGRGDELFTGCDLLWSEAFVLDALAQIILLVRGPVVDAFLCAVVWRVGGPHRENRAHRN